MNDGVQLELTHSEALVLFEWLARIASSGALVVEDPAEEQVLWRLEGQLEKKLVEPLGPHYKEAVEAARRAVRAAAG